MGQNTNHSRHNCEWFKTFARQSWDIRAIVSRHSPERRSVLFTRNLVTKCLIYVAIGSQFSTRQVRDGFETPAMTLRLFGEEFFRIKFLNMFKILANRLRLFATQARNLRITVTVSRPLWDSLANVSRKQSHPSEIGASVFGQTDLSKQRRPRSDAALCGVWS